MNRRHSGAIVALTVAFLLLAGGSYASNDANDPFSEVLGSGEHGSFQLPDPVVSARIGENVSYDIHYTRWQSDAPDSRDLADVVVVYNHGLQSHRGWFAPTAMDLASRGAVVYAFDRIGSGTSSGGFQVAKGEANELRGHVRDWTLFLDSLEEMLRLVNQQEERSSVVLWGNSYGAKVVTAFLWQRENLLKGLNISAAVLTAPGNFRNAKTMPLPFSRARLLLAKNTRRFSVPMVEVDDDNGAHWFVAPGPWFDRIRDDDLSLRQATRRFYLETRKLDKANRKVQGEFPVPLFVAMVENDLLMDNTKMAAYVDGHAGPETVRKFYQGGAESKHFLLFTSDAPQVRADIAEFLAGSTP